MNIIPGISARPALAQGEEMLETHKCSICGEEDYEYMMHKVFTGRVKWLCNKCYQNGEREAHIWEIHAIGQYKKVADAKKKEK